MIRTWMGLLAIHSSVCLALTALLVLEGTSVSIPWLPETRDLVFWTMAAFCTGPILGTFVAVWGPRPLRSDPEQRAKAARRIKRIVGLLIPLLILLILGMALAKTHRGVAEVTEAALTASAALLAFLSPWIALYGRWFRAA